MNNNNNRNLDFLDMLTALSFILQVQNIDEDNIETNFIHTVIKTISNEIEKLHKENDIIVEKIDLILKKLEEGKNNNGINKTSR